MIVVDASVLIAFLDERDGHHAAAVQLLSGNDESFSVHTLNLAEPLVYGVQTNRLDQMATAIAALGVHEYERLPAESRRLAQMRAATGLKLPECCALALAEATSSALATFDARLASIARQRAVAVLDGTE